ncbi:MAG: DUF1071 domain-containing protein [Bacteroidales bacterium]|nr:DUF1071 domain-containing protein [Bacteroidales bacterium]
MIKSYEEMRKVDVTRYCEDRDGFSYLNWAKCIDLLRQNGAEKAYFVPIPDEKTGNCLRCSEEVFEDKSHNTNRCYETRIKVVIDDNEWEFQSPVLNGSNPVKDNSMNQLRVWTSMCRSFVKCVAIQTGLGFDLWLKEEMQPFHTVIPEKDGKPTIPELEVLEDLCKKHHIDLDDWIKRGGKTRKSVTGKEVGAMLLAIKERYGED